LSIQTSPLNKLKLVTGRSDWRETDGPDSKHGVDHWFKNDDGEIIYCNDDQGHVVYQDESEEIIFEGELDEVQQ